MTLKKCGRWEGKKIVECGRRVTKKTRKKIKQEKKDHALRGDPLEGGEYRSTRRAHYFFPSKIKKVFFSPQI